MIGLIRGYDLKQREVIDIISARRLGYIHDVDVDFETGRITSIIVPGRFGGLQLFGKRSEYVIPWDRIVAVGRDLVLVRLDGLETVE